MRFHCGISFSWRTIKKFLFPFLIGVLGVLGFNYIFENKDNLPFKWLTFTTPVYASENYDTKYDFSYSGLDRYTNFSLDNNSVKLVDLVSTLKANNNIVRDYLVVIGENQSVLYFYVFDNLSNYTFNVYGTSSNVLKYYFTSDNSSWGYSISLNNISDIYQNSSYLNFISCITGGTCNTLSNFSGSHQIFTSSTSINNNSSNVLYFNPSSDYILYYSSKYLTIDNSYGVDNFGFIYKSLYMNNQSFNVGSSFPTYYDYISSVQPNPDDPDEPILVHKGFFNKVYWFDDNSTSLGVLSNIYELLFFYCISVLLIKALSFIKNSGGKK